MLTSIIGSSQYIGTTPNGFWISHRQNKNGLKVSSVFEILHVYEVHSLESRFVYCESTVTVAASAHTHSLVASRCDAKYDVVGQQGGNVDNRATTKIMRLWLLSTSGYQGFETCFDGCCA